MTTIINLIGAPCTQKSTLAAEIYAKMKRQGLNVEMVREVAKKYVLEGKKIDVFQQLTILGEQIKEESSLFNKVDYIVTDSPVLLGAFYLEYNHYEGFASQFIHSYYHFSKNQGIKFLNYLLPRRGDYDSKGRIETEQEAKFIDIALLNYLPGWGYDFKHLREAELQNEEIVDIVLGDLK